MPPKFFRKEALAKLSTPEKLDQLIKVTNPRAWVALLTFILMICTGLAWAFMGTTKTKIQASGIIMSGDVYNVVSTTSGQVLELKVELNEVVKAGQVIAIVSQPDIAQQIQEAEAAYAENQIQLAQGRQFGNQDSQIQEQLITEQKSSLEEKIRINKGRINYLSKQLTTEEDLLEKGLITNSQVEQTRQQVIGLRNENKSIAAQITQTESQQLNVSFSQKQKLTSLQQGIAQSQRRIEQLKEQFKFRSQIVSQHSGKIVEIMTEPGVIVSPGVPLLKLGTDVQTSDRDLRAILFIPSKDGKKIKEGMEALISPSTVKPQEYGYMKAKITYVSDYPATQQGMMNVLKNEQLVRQMLSLGVPFEAYVEFEKDPDTTDSYVWTSKEGAPLEIFPGTICSARLTVQQQTPIALVLPALKEFFELH